jgi:hypothetical protein
MTPDASNYSDIVTGVLARGKGRRLLVPHANPLDVPLARSESVMPFSESPDTP